MNTDQTKLIYSSPNGDDWFLCCDSATGRAFVKHRANASSGGRETDFEIGVFLNRGPHNPEHEALLRLIEDSAALEPKGRADRQSGAPPSSDRPIARDVEVLHAELAVLQADLSAALANLHEARQALRRLREEVESRSGAMTAPEHTGPPFAEEAEQIARGVIAIYERALAAERRLREN